MIENKMFSFKSLPGVLCNTKIAFSKIYYKNVSPNYYFDINIYLTIGYQINQSLSISTDGIEIPL